MIAAIVGDGACEIDRKITIDVNYNSIKFLKKHFNKKIQIFGFQKVLILYLQPHIF